MEQLIAEFPASKKAKTGVGGICRSCLGLPSAEAEMSAKADQAQRRQRMCGDKARHDTFESAVASALRANRKRGTPLRVYECPVCSGFHLTSRVVRVTA